MRAGLLPLEILKRLPHVGRELEPENIRQTLGFAARNLDESVQPIEAV